MTEEEKKERNRVYCKKYRHSHPEKIKEIKKRYRAKIKKNKGVFIYNDKEEHFFKTQVEAARFFGFSSPIICKIVNTNYEYKGWSGEKAL